MRLNKLISVLFIGVIMVGGGCKAANIDKPTSTVSNSKSITSTDYNHAMRYFKKGNEHFNNRRFFKAINNYKKSVRNDPRNFGSWYNMGLSYINTHNYKLAIEPLKKATSLKPEYIKSWFCLGNAHLKLRNYTEAIAAFDKAIYLNSQYIEAWYFVGFAYNRLKSQEKAENAFHTAVELSTQHLLKYPNDLIHWRILSYSYYNLKYYEKAVTALEKAILIEPENKETRMSMSETCILTKDYQKALVNSLSGLKLVSLQWEKAVCTFFAIASLRMQGKDTTEYENRLNILLEKDFVLGWDFDDIREWLDKGTIKAEDKAFITKYIVELEKHKEISSVN